MSAESDVGRGNGFSAGLRRPVRSSRCPLGSQSSTAAFDEVSLTIRRMAASASSRPRRPPHARNDTTAESPASVIIWVRCCVPERWKRSASSRVARPSRSPATTRDARRTSPQPMLSKTMTTASSRMLTNSGSLRSIDQVAGQRSMDHFMGDMMWNQKPGSEGASSTSRTLRATASVVNGLAK